MVIWLKVRSSGIGYAELGLSYEQCVKHKEIWRFFTAQLTHVEPLHLLLNMSTLWSIGNTERTPAGLRDYVKNSLLLVYLVPVVGMLMLDSAAIAIIWIVIPKAQNDHRDATAEKLLRLQVCLAIYHALIVFMKKPHFAEIRMVGYSGVLFGWLTILTQREISCCFSFKPLEAQCKPLP